MCYVFNIMIPNFIKTIKQILWRRISQSEIRNSTVAEKRGRAKIPSPRPPSFLPARAIGFQILKFRVRIFGEESSNIVQETPPVFTFCEIIRSCLGVKRLGMVFFRYFKGIFEVARQRAVGNAEVHRAKLWQNEILQTNLFSFAFGERLSVFFFDCPKTNLKTIWTT